MYARDLVVASADGRSTSTSSTADSTVRRVADGDRGDARRAYGRRAARSMRTASASSRGLPRTSPSTTTIVSAPMTTASGSRLRDRGVFSRARRSACSRGASPARYALVDVGGTAPRARMPMSVSSSRRRGDATRGPRAPASSLEPEGHRSVVHELDVHHRAELARLDAHAALAEQRDEALVQRDRLSRGAPRR